MGLFILTHRLEYKSRVNLANPKEKSFRAETFNGIQQGRFQGLEANGT